MLIASLVETDYTTIPSCRGMTDIKSVLEERDYTVVIDNGTFLGILTPADIVHKAHVLAIDCITTKPRLHCHDSVDHTLHAMGDKYSALPVFRGEEFAGVLTLRKISGFLKAYARKLDDVVEQQKADLKTANEKLREESCRRKEMEHSLHLKDFAVESSINAIAIADLTGKIFYINPSFLGMWGCRYGEDVYGRSVLEFWEHPGRAEKIVEHLLEKGSWRGENNGRKKNGEIVDVLISANLVKDDTGNPVAIMASFLDVTRQKKALRQLQEYESVVTAMINSTEEAMFLTDIAGTILVANRAMASRFGHTPETMKNRNIFSIIPPDLAAARQKYLCLMLQSSQPVRFEDTRGDRILNNSFYPVCNENGNIVKVAVFSHDVTAQRETERQLRRNERWFRNIVETAEEGIWIIDAEEKTVYVNPKMAEMLNCPATEIIGRSLYNFVDDTWTKPLDEYVEKRRAGGTGKFDFRFRRPDNSYFWGYVSTSPLTSDDDSYVGALAMVSDITERKSMEEELRIKDMAMSSSISAMAITNLEGNLIYANDAFRRMWGYTHEDTILGRDTALFWQDTDAARLKLTELHEQGLLTGTMRAEKKDGTTFEASYSACVVHDNLQQPLFYITSFIDITSEIHYKDLLEYRLKVESLVNDISRYFINVSGDEYDHHLNRALEQVGHIVDVDRVYIFRKREKEYLLDNTHEWCRPGISPQIDNLQDIHPDKVSWFMERLMLDNHVLIPRVSDMPDTAENEKKMLASQNIQSLLAVPMRCRGRFDGFVGFDSVQCEKTWTEEDIAALMTLADILSNAFERRKAEHARARQRKKIKSMYRHEKIIAHVSMKLNSADMLDDAIQDVLRYVSTGMGNIDICVVLKKIESAEGPEFWSSRECSCCGESDSECPLHPALISPCLQDLHGSIHVKGDGDGYSCPSRCRFSRGRGEVSVYPIRTREVTRGYVCVYHPEEGVPDSYHHVYETIAHILANFHARHQHMQEKLAALKKEEDALRIAEQASHLASLGTLAAGITHEINQPLSGLKVTVDSILYWKKKNMCPEVDEIFQYLHMISKQADRISEIIKHVNVFAKGRGEETVVDVNAVILRVTSLLHQRFTAHDITIHYYFTEGLPGVPGYETHVEQIVSNILVNAMHALDTIAGDEKKIIIETAIREQHIVVTVFNNGPRIPDEHIDCICDPFFSTKNDERGMGLGLYICKNILDAMNGTIDVVNRDNGVMFTITLPLQPETTKARCHENIDCR